MGGEWNEKKGDTEYRYGRWRAGNRCEERGGDREVDRNVKRKVRKADNRVEY